jgi:hypothetical protein
MTWGDTLSISQTNAYSASMRGARCSTVSTTAYLPPYENVSAQVVCEYTERAHAVLVLGEHNVAVADQGRGAYVYGMADETGRAMDQSTSVLNLSTASLLGTHKDLQALARFLKDSDVLTKKMAPSPSLTPGKPMRDDHNNPS